MDIMHGEHARTRHRKINEAVLCEKEGKAFSDIDTYHAAIGLKIDRIILFGTEEALFLDEQARHCFGKDIGFVCGDKTLILREEINILCMNRRREEERFIECDGMFDVPVIGKPYVELVFLIMKSTLIELGIVSLRFTCISMTVQLFGLLITLESYQKRKAFHALRWMSLNRIINIVKRRRRLSFAYFC